MLALAQSLVELGSAIASNAARRAVGTLIGLLCVLGLGATSALFLTMAAYRALEQTTGEIQASLICGGLYLIAALIALVALQARKL